MKQFVEIHGFVQMRHVSALLLQALSLIICLLTTSSLAQHNLEREEVYQLPDSIKRYMVSDEFIFETYGWPLLVRHDSTALAQRVLDEIKRAANKLGRARLQFGVTIIDSLTSPFFNSRYYFAFVQYVPWSFGWMAPYTQALRTKDSLRIEILDSVELAIDNQIPSFVRSSRIVATDFNQESVTDSQMIAMSIDAVTLASTQRPVLFLSNIQDVERYSNSVASEAFWHEEATDDSIKALLASIRLLEVGENLYFRADYGEARYPPSMFDAYRNTVTQPICSQGESGSRQVVLYTWSPDSGYLIRWIVVLNSKQQLTIEWQVIAEYLGFSFWFL